MPGITIDALKRPYRNGKFMKRTQQTKTIVYAKVHSSIFLSQGIDPLSDP